MNYKTAFIANYKRCITREGSEELLASLEKSDFFTAPASTRFHECYEGGLCEHSNRVFNNLYAELKHSEISLETIAIVSLLHDLCKIGFYTVEQRNTKVDGKWVQVPYYKVEDKFPYGHGCKSVFLIERFMRLTEEEAISITHHMGAYTDSSNWSTLAKAYELYPLSLHLHVADLKATYLK